MARSDNHVVESRLLLLASIAVVVAALYLAKEVLIPLALATLLAFLLGPLVHWAERLGMGRVAAVLVVAGVVFALLGLLGWLIAGQMTELAAQVGQYSGNIEAKMRAFRENVGALLGRATRTMSEFREGLATSQPAQAATTQVAAPPPPQETVAILSVVQSILGSVTSTLLTAGVVIVLVIFLLVQREDLRDRLIRLIGEGKLNVTTQAMDDVAGRVSRYLLMQAAINGAGGALIAGGLFLLGIPGALLWGLLAALLRFIPYVGIWMAAAGPILLGLAIASGWVVPLLVLGLYIAVELAAYNFFEPLLYGSSTGVSPFAILVAAVFWAWLWGPVGLILATPMTVCLAVIGRHVPQLGFLDILLGDQPVLEPPVRFYQRLAAMDTEEAAELIDEQLTAGQTLAQVYDRVILPALSIAEEAHRYHRLEPDRRESLFQAIREILDDLAERFHLGSDLQLGPENVTHRGGDTAGAQAAQGSVLCIPARDKADELAAIMLVHLLRESKVAARFVSASALASERLALAEQSNADLLCISATPPAALRAARYLCKRLAGRLTSVRRIVGLWNAAGDLTRLAERLQCPADTAVVTSLADAVGHVRPLVGVTTARAITT